MRISKLTTVERDNLSPSPSDGGWFIYNTTTDKYQVFNENTLTWVDIAILQDIAGKKISTISMYPSPNNIPLNELVLTGTLASKQEIDKVIYADLYAVIGDVHGVPVNPANFVLPPVIDLLVKGGTALTYTNNGGSDILTTNQLPIVNANGTISVSQNDGSIPATNGAYFANVSDGNTNYTGFITNGNQGTTVAVTGVNVNFGSGQPHEHPYQNFIFTICFQEVGVNQVAPTPNLQQVTDVGNTTTNSIIVNDINSVGAEIIINQTDVGAGIDNQLRLEGGSLLVRDIANGNFTLIGTNGFQFTRNNTNTISLNVNTLTANRNQAYQDKSGTIALVEDLPIFLDEFSTFADLQANRRHIYIGNAPLTIDLDTAIAYPLPVPTQQNLVIANQSFYVFEIVSGGGASGVSLPPLYSTVEGVNFDDFGNGYWEISYGAYITAMSFQQVIQQGNTTRDAFFVVNNPDTYRTRYSTIGTQIQRDDLGNRINYEDIGITLLRQAGNKSWALQIPDITSNANSSSFLVDFRPDVSGTVAYLSDITNITEQNHTSGGSVIINDGVDILYVDPASTIASLTVILPENPINGQEVKVSFGGTITAGTVATALAIVGNTGHTVLAGASITTANAGDGFIFKFQSSTNLWRIF